MLREPNTANKTRESGGIGRRARLRGVWSDSYGFKSRLSHHERTGSYEPVFSCPKTGLEPKARPLRKHASGMFLGSGAATAARCGFAERKRIKSRLCGNTILVSLCYNITIITKGGHPCSVSCCRSSIWRSSVWAFRTRSLALPGRRSTRNSASRSPTPASSRRSSPSAPSSRASSAPASSRS